MKAIWAAGLIVIGSAAMAENPQPAQFRISGKSAKAIYVKMAKEGFDPDPSNGGNHFYASVECSWESPVAGGDGTDADYSCAVADSGRGP